MDMGKSQKIDKSHSILYTCLSIGWAHSHSSLRTLIKCCACQQWKGDITQVWIFYFLKFDKQLKICYILVRIGPNLTEGQNQHTQDWHALHWAAEGVRVFHVIYTLRIVIRSIEHEEHDDNYRFLHVSAPWFSRQSFFGQDKLLI